MNHKKKVAYKITAGMVILIAVLVSGFYIGSNTAENSVWFGIKFSHKGWQTILVMLVFMGAQLGVTEYFAFKFLQEKAKISNKLHKNNKVLLIVTFAFTALYLVALQLFRGGLVESVTSVTDWVMLVVTGIAVFILENKRHTWFFGKRLSLPKQMGWQVTKYYLFGITGMIIVGLWMSAMTHVTVSYFAFIECFMILIQMMLIFTSIHFSKYWNLLIECVWVLHITVICLMASGIFYLVAYMSLLLLMIYQLSEVSLKVKTKVGSGIVLTLLWGGIVALKEIAFLPSSLNNGSSALYIQILLLVLAIVLFVAYKIEKPNLFESDPLQ